MASCPKCGASNLKRKKGWLRCKHCGPISGPVEPIPINMAITPLPTSIKFVKKLIAFKERSNEG